MNTLKLNTPKQKDYMITQPFIHFDTDNKITAPTNYYDIELGRTLSTDDIAVMHLERMPGFILKWTYGPEIASGNTDHKIQTTYGYTWKYDSNMKSWKMKQKCLNYF